MITDSYNKIFDNKTRIMLVFAHPDDTEIFAGGLVARLTKDGKIVRSVKMTSGNNGSRQNEISREDLEKERANENAKSMKILGIKSEDNVFLGLDDGAVEENLETIGKVVYQIREFKPDIIITHNPEHVIIHFAKNENWVNHRDHKNTGLVTTYAAYPYSRDVLFFPEQLKKQGIDSHTTKEFLYVDYYGHEDEVFFDITATIDEKISSTKAHATQFSEEGAESLAEFLSTHDDSGKKFERFRYVVVD